MARSRSRSPRLTIGRSVACGRVRSPSLRCMTRGLDGVGKDQEVEFLSKAAVEEEPASEEAVGSGGNEVMAVVDLSDEAKWALEWALSHAVQAHDTIVILHVCKRKNTSNGKQSARVYDLLQSMKKNVSEEDHWGESGRGDGGGEGKRPGNCRSGNKAEGVTSGARAKKKMEGMAAAEEVGMERRCGRWLQQPDG